MSESDGVLSQVNLSQGLLRRLSDRLIELLLVINKTELLFLGSGLRSILFSLNEGC